MCGLCIFFMCDIYIYHEIFVTTSKLLETQEQEIEDWKASKISLQHLITKLNEEREVKNAEILRIKVTG